jgi:hypothetical protein
MAAQLKNPEYNIEIKELKHTPLKLWGIFFAILIGIYGSWLISFWPGSLGEDSLAVIIEIQNPELLHAGKPPFWHYFIKGILQAFNRIECITALLLTVSALIFSRILSWCWANNIKKACVFLLVFFCITPHTVFNIGNIYADGIYAIAATGLIFEIWLSAKTKKISATSLFLICLMLPIAAFFRSNGIVYLIALLCLVFFLELKDKIKLIAVSISWVAIAIFSQMIYEGRSHGVFYPLALFETVNFLQPRPMNFWREKPRVSEKTIKTLEEYSDIKKIISHYDRDYWDPLIYNPNGPLLNGLSKQQKSVIVKEFITYNIWQNIPAFMGSRLNVFMTSVLAEGGLPSFPYTENILSRIKTKSQYRPFNQKNLIYFWEKIDETSKKYRWITWSPIPGFMLLIWLLTKSIKQLNIPVLLVTIPCAVQIVAIFFLSIAGEYRYLLPFFLLPVAAIPIAIIEYKKYVPATPA